MKTRSAVVLVPLLALLTLPAAARPNPKTLVDLRAQKDMALGAHHQVMVKINRLVPRVSSLEKDLQRLVSKERRLKREEPGFLHGRRLLSVLQEKRRVSMELARARTQLREEQDDEKVRRMSLIESRWGLVKKLFEQEEKADRTGRKEQATGYRKEASGELKHIAEEESLPDVELPPLALAKIDPDSPAEELEEILAFYEALQEQAHDRAKQLLPKEQRRSKRVSFLDERVNKRGYVSLKKMLDQERLALERISKVRRAAEERADRYRVEIEKIEVLIEKRLKEPKPEEDEG